MLYILSLALLIALSVVIVLLMPKMKNTKLTNAIFVCTTFLLYFASALVIYLQVGASDWNFQNQLPVANVSPFMFTAILLYFALPKRAGGGTF